MAEDAAPNPLNLLQPIMDQLAELQRQFAQQCQTSGSVGTSKDVIKSAKCQTSRKRPSDGQETKSNSGSAGSCSVLQVPRQNASTKMAE